MGIGVDILDLLIRLRSKGLIRTKSAIVEIGAQQLANSFLSEEALVARVGYLFGVKDRLHLPAVVPSQVIHGELEHLAANAPLAREFWRWLGFDYAAIDIDGSPASIPLDLNYDRVPCGSKGRYHLVTNFGTTEHVANQLNAFEVIHDLTAAGGLMIHQLPAQGMFNHGLVNYNMKFFWMLGRSNGYKFIESSFFASSEDYEFPDEIVDFLRSGEPKSIFHWRDYKAADAGILVVLQKCFDTPFVAPIDVPTGTDTSNAALKRRYWSVFSSSPFDRMTPHNHTTRSATGRASRRQ